MMNQKMRNMVHGASLKKILAAGVLLLIMLSILTYVTVSWFLNQHILNTVAMVEVPSKISILDGDKQALTQINLNYDASNVGEDGKTVTVERPVCIESTSDFYLELAHTTNISGLTCTLYPASYNSSEGKWTAAGSAVSGEFLNPADGSNNTLASNLLHAETYNTDTNVQKNAEPLYWMSGVQSISESETAVVDSMTVYYTYYVLRIQWEADKKETDLLYLMAVHSGAV